jgi:hypothetical protein
MFRFTLLGLGLLLHLTAPAQKSALLWEISGNGLQKPSYLFGTIHLLCPQDFRLSDEAKARLAASQQLALELDFDDPGMMTAMQQTMRMSGGKTLKSVLSESDYTLVANYFKDSLKMPLAPFASSKPFVLTSLLYPRLLGCAPKSYELDLVQLAKKDKKEVIGLETVEEQMAVFDKIPYEKQAEQVVKTVKDPAKARKDFAELVKLYRSENIKKMPRMANSDSGFEGYEGDLLENRNRRWIPLIEREAREMPTFFAVGAAHLGGKTGVIRLLKKAGFTVRAVE